MRASSDTVVRFLVEKQIQQYLCVATVRWIGISILSTSFSLIFIVNGGSFEVDSEEQLATTIIAE